MSMLLGALLATAASVAAPPVAAPKPVAVAARPNRDQVMAAVRAEWPKYDASAKGRLTPLEFSTWVMKSHGGTVAARAHAGGIAPVSAMNASSTAFARADLNHDGGVTPDEMTRFLMTPPAPTAITKARAIAKSAPTAAARTATAAGN
ncbi:hypothetical protein DMC47_44330 [Nostoc sp. 3335mG]|nr:hypothetical protein DMC47_44330 [Nostoc sp. 3335mG]